MSDINNTSSRPRAEGERRRRRRKRRSPVKTVLKILGTLMLIGLTTGVLLACFAAIYIKTVIMPQAPLDLSCFSVGLNSVLYYVDKDGQEHELRALHGDESRVWVEYKDLPKDLINATVSIEDERFWTHQGVDWKRTAAAVVYMFTGRSIQGGSTITQQLIKNLTEYKDTTVQRKVVEIFRALDFDRTYGKETTLEWYLNYIYMGRGCYGVYTASYMYFGKPVEELTVAECASLISITNNPSLYDPYTNPENNARRKNLVLKKMNELGYLSDEEYEQAKAQELVFTSKKVETVEEKNEGTEVYSWYEEQVITDVTADLAEKYGISKELAYKMVLTGGLSIYTCVDPELQEKVESIYQNVENFNYPSKTGQQLQSAITVIDNATGDVVAMVGQVGEKTGNRWRNNATVAYRQPGSSIKPLSVYAPALDMGLVTPMSIIDDYPYELTSNEKPYPVNSGNARYKGLTTVFSGLTNSTNTIAFRILTDLVTPAASFNFVEQKFKIDLVDARQEGNTIKTDMDRAPLSMGGLTDGVNTRDMTEAFAVFPNQGLYRESRTYTKVLDANQNVILEKESTSEPVIKESTAYYINTMLQNVVTSGTGYEARLENMHVAGKTGSTTSDYDRWFAGYTPYYTAVVWTGYSTPERVQSSGNPAARTWNKVMTLLHEGLEDKNYFTINNLVTVDYCLDSGLIATDACRNDPRGSRVAKMTLLRDDAPTGFCTIHSEAAAVTVCKDDPILDASGKETGLYHIAGPYCPEESLMTVNLLDYNRVQIGTAVALDEKYTLHYTQEQGYCTVHATPPEPETPVQPEDSWVWPDPDDPNWVHPNPDTDPEEGTGTGEEMDPGASGPDDNEPYVPAGH